MPARRFRLIRISGRSDIWARLAAVPPAGRRNGMTPAADPRKRWLRRLIGYCWRYPRLVTFPLLGSLVATAVAVIIPPIHRDIVNNTILTHRQPLSGDRTLLVIAALVSLRL